MLMSIMKLRTKSVKMWVILRSRSSFVHKLHEEICHFRYLKSVGLLSPLVGYYISSLKIWDDQINLLSKMMMSK